MKSRRWWIGLALVALFLSFSTSAIADEIVDEEVVDEDLVAEEFADEAAEADDDGIGGLHHQSLLQIRATPVGLSLWSDTGYKFGLFDSEELLFADTYVDAGITTALSPAFAWAGPYVEILPLAVLNLRFSAQFMGYFGNFGYLYVPDDEAREWTLSALDESADQGLGQASTGLLLKAQATPQMRVGRVVFQAESSFNWMRMDVEDQYYEPYFDLFFAPTDSFWMTRPTLGYLLGRDLSHSYLLLGARWERVAVNTTEVVRDTVGVVFNWKIPPTLMEWGDPAFSGFGGVFLNHPNRGQVSPYLGLQFIFQF